MYQELVRKYEEKTNISFTVITFEQKENNSEPNIHIDFDEGTTIAEAQQIKKPLLKQERKTN